MIKIKFHTELILIGLFLLLAYACSTDQQAKQKASSIKDPSPYLNHSDSARYVGMKTCASCHNAIYTTFIKTGMGSSFDHATPSKSSADFLRAIIYDPIQNYHYQAFWQEDSLYFKEYRLNKKDTTHLRVEQVNYIIGSGQHTNSHLQIINGYVNQMPMTYYTQKKQWDLPPGFESGFNTRFSRKIGLECMSCHNAYPEFEMGSENKYTRIPNGIDCERCHGPGSIHVAQRSSGAVIDTSRYIDYSIVNPAKLSMEAQFDICQRCHLQGNAVLKEGKSFYDFLPGKKLSDIMSVFLPKYKNADDEFIMASHADRLKQSACFIKSSAKSTAKNALKPYKDALTCVTCHNPHISVKSTGTEVYNQACLNCHSTTDEKQMTRSLESVHSHLNKGSFNNCVSCHMPLSGATDIPHVTVHDHYIRKPINKKEKDKIKTFVGLYSVNEKHPDELTRAKAYLQQYEKFDQDPQFLDSAEKLLMRTKDFSKNKHSFIHLYFLKQNYSAIFSLLVKYNEHRLLDSVFIHSSYDNNDAWAAYRIGESFVNTSNAKRALPWYKKAVELAPFNLDFRNKYATALAAQNNLAAAEAEYNFILKENPKMVSAYTNLGYIKWMKGSASEALKFYQMGEKLDPDNEALLLNLAAYYLYMKQAAKAKVYVGRILKKNPANQKALSAMKQISVYE